jgi:hypothetical protein
LQRVVISGWSSPWLPVKSGVPQGSILGPLLFLLYINDLPDVVKYSKIALFADDAKMYINIESEDDCKKLQKDLDAVYEWSSKWCMTFNVTKCKILKVTRSINPYLFNYNINGTLLESVNEIRDLGVIIDKTVSWNSHVKDIVAKANRIMGLIKRTVGFNVSYVVKYQLYNSLVRSKLEYCTQVWGGLSKSNMVKIERVQRRATRYILNFSDLDYKHRLSMLNMLPLSYRRDVSDILFYHQCFYKNSINTNEFVHLTSNNCRYSRSSDDPTKLRMPFCRTQAYKNTYFNRIVKLWNAIPAELRAMPDKNIFKRNILNYF